MKYIIPSLHKSVEPSQEGIGAFVLGVLAAPFLIPVILMSLVGICAKIGQWREAMKSPWQKLQDTIERMREKRKNKWWCLWPHDCEFPYGKPTQPNAAGTNYFSLNPNKHPARSKVDGIIPYKEFKDRLLKLQKCVEAVAGSIDTDNCIKKIDDTFKANFKKTDFEYEKDGKTIKKFAYKTTSASWPNDNWYKDLDENCQDIGRTALAGLDVAFGKLADRYKQVVEEKFDPNDKSEENKKELQNRVAFVETCLIYCKLVDSLLDDWRDNLGELVDGVDVVWWDDDKEPIECGFF